MTKYEGKIITSEGEIAYILPLHVMGNHFAIGNRHLRGVKKDDPLLNVVARRKRYGRSKRFGKKNTKKKDEKYETEKHA